MFTRRDFFASSLVAFAAGANPLPEFSWNTLPVFTHMGKSEGDFTAEEVRALARFPLVTIEKAQAIRQGRSCEEGIYEAAREIKRVNPRTKVLFYFNAVVDWPGYEARAEFERHPEWALRNPAGRLSLFRERMQFDLSNPGLREWWSNVCGKAMQSAPLDGVFMDAIPKIAMLEKQQRQAFGDRKYEALEAGLRDLMRLTKQKIGPNRVLLYNGLRGDRSRWKDGGMRYLEYADAAMIEHFAGISAVEPGGAVRKDWLAADMEMIEQAGAMGKMILVKAWPGFTRTYPDTSKYPPTYEEKTRAARREILFPLAAFLAAAGAYSYFGYAWWYRAQDGGLLWYPEYDKPLGRPKGPAVRSDYRYEREFEHARIQVDLAENRAHIEWD